MLDLLEPRSLAQVVPPKKIGRDVDRPHGDAKLLRPMEDLFFGVMPAPLAQDVVELVHVIEPDLSVGESRVVDQLGPLDQHEDVGIPSREHEDHPSVLARGGVGLAASKDRSLVGPRRRGPAVRREHRLHGRDVHVLAPARSPRPPQRRQRRQCRLAAGVELWLVAGHHQRLLVAVPAEVHVPAQSVVDDLFTLPAAVRARLAEVRHRGEHDGGVAPAQGR